MRGSDTTTGSLFSYVDLERRVPARHPLRLIRAVVNEALATLDPEFAKLYAAGGPPSIAPEKLLRGSLLQAFFSIRSERQLMEQLHYNLLFRWFVGLGLDDPVWDHSTYSKNRDRLLEARASWALCTIVSERDRSRSLPTPQADEARDRTQEQRVGPVSLRYRDGERAVLPRGP
jgi:transposase